MAYNNRYGSRGSNGLEIGDIHGRSTNPYIGTAIGGSRSNSPQKSEVNPKFAEVLSSDVVYANEAKVKNHIRFLNKEGVIGPFVGIKENGPVPKSPQIPMGSSSYQMHFSPSKNMKNLQNKLVDTYPTTNIMSSSMGLRHLSNGDAYKRTKFLSSSIDYTSRRESRQDMRVIKGQMKDLDQKGEDFRFKKNFTNNADRIIANNSITVVTPASNSSKYDEIKRASQNLLNSPNGVLKDPAVAQANSLITKYGKENKNQNNVKFAPVPKDNLREPVGGYSTATMKRNLAYSPSVNGDLARLIETPAKAGVSIGAGRKATSSSSTNMNDLSYHRSKYLNNYGFDVLTGVRKESPNRLL